MADYFENQVDTTLAQDFDADVNAMTGGDRRKKYTRHNVGYYFSNGHRSIHPMDIILEDIFMMD